jgi:hypothetical protein
MAVEFKINGHDTPDGKSPLAQNQEERENMPINIVRYQKNL